VIITVIAVSINPIIQSRTPYVRHPNPSYVTIHELLIYRLDMIAESENRSCVSKSRFIEVTHIETADDGVSET
jgi:hypothetical protein